jgi:uncharacterized Zn ribbon protein
VPNASRRGVSAERAASPDRVTSPSVVAGYAVAYINADDEMKVRLSVGSNDQCKVWVNGKLIVKFTETRTLDKDTDSGGVTLAKGQNVLVFKVINEKNNWQGAARFLQNGAPVKNITVATAPK